MLSRPQSTSNVVVLDLSRYNTAFSRNDDVHGLLKQQYCDGC